MPINLPPPSLNEDMFTTCCETLPLNVKEQIASTYPFYFSPAFVFGDAPTASEPVKPALAKTKAPKAATSAKPRERTMSLSATENEAAHAIIDCVKHNAGIRSRDIGTPLTGAAKSRILAFLVKTGAISVQGKAAGARYYPKGSVDVGESEAAE